MESLFDIHCHIIPGVDDGPSSMEEAVKVLKLEAKEGVGNIIVTPHYRREMFEIPLEIVESQFWLLQEEAEKEYL